MPDTTLALRVADEVWIAVAHLHRELPARADFTLKEIEARLRRENLTGTVRRGVYPHVSVHCVANLPPNPARYRMLFSTGPSRRRLFRPGDSFHPKRDGGKTVPRRDDIPDEYRRLLDWYHEKWAPRTGDDPLVEVARKHRIVWKGTDPDEYVRRLREGWE